MPWPPFHLQSLPVTSSQTRSQPSQLVTPTPRSLPGLFISRREADLIGLEEAGHTPPCQGLGWRLPAPGGPRLCKARRQLPGLWPADPEALWPHSLQLRWVPYLERGWEALSLNVKSGGR